MHSMVTASKKPARKIFVFDWDQTSTQLGGGTNEAATQYGFDYFTTPLTQIKQNFLIPGLQDAVLTILNQGHQLIIGTSQPMPQIIRRGLQSILGARANEVIIACADPKNLVATKSFLLRQLPNNLAAHLDVKKCGFTVPLHTKNLMLILQQGEEFFMRELARLSQLLNEDPLNERHLLEVTGLYIRLEKYIKELTARAGVADNLQARYAKSAWDEDDALQFTQVMRQVRESGAEVTLLESEKEFYIWKNIVSVCSTQACKEIVYVDDSERRLKAFDEATPESFRDVPRHTIHVAQCTNQHLEQIFEILGVSNKLELPLDDVRSLQTAFFTEFRTLTQRLEFKSENRLKKATTGHRPMQRSFFLSDNKLLFLSHTMIPLRENLYMVVGAHHDKQGIHAKTKTSFIYEIDNLTSHIVQKSQGLVKIHFLKKQKTETWSEDKKKFITQVRNEAAMLRKYNNFGENDVLMNVNEVLDGLRIYMSMPSLGQPLSSLDTHSYSLHQLIEIFQKILKVLMTLHKDDICHYDLKLEHMLMDLQTGAVFIVDFGSAAPKGVPHNVNETISPPRLEIDDSSYYGLSYDIYTLGLAMANFFGYSKSDSPATAEASPQRSGYRLPDDVTENLNDPSTLLDFTEDRFSGGNDEVTLKNLLTRMLARDFTDRPSAEECDRSLSIISSSTKALKMI